mmetsp:Transcript_56757/g.132955  ORF Transcript_56757/g.132955 Transcript_56757/m.132955 type:complete len:277 (-) Transcript_56757:951-1781(-)
MASASQGPRPVKSTRSVVTRAQGVSTRAYANASASRSEERGGQRTRSRCAAHVVKSARTRWEAAGDGARATTTMRWSGYAEASRRPRSVRPKAAPSGSSSPTKTTTETASASLSHDDRTATTSDALGWEGGGEGGDRGHGIGTTPSHPQSERQCAPCSRHRSSAATAACCAAPSSLARFVSAVNSATEGVCCWRAGRRCARSRTRLLTTPIGVPSPWYSTTDASTASPRSNTSASPRPSRIPRRLSRGSPMRWSTCMARCGSKRVATRTCPRSSAA